MNPSQQEARLLFSRNAKLKDTVSLKTIDVRNTVLQNFENILFLDDEYAKKNDIEQVMWKHCFYKIINEYRSVIKSSPGKVSNYQLFLKDSIQFYIELLKRFDKLNYPVFKIYVFLGDLERYLSEIEKKGYSRAQGYYLQAVHDDPDQGLGYNQLAVIASYQNDFLQALYFNLRGFYAKMPYLPSKENLFALMNKNPNDSFSKLLSYFFTKEYLKDKFEKLNQIGKVFLNDLDHDDLHQVMMVCLILDESIKFHLEPFIELALECFSRVKELTCVILILKMMIKYELKSNKLLIHLKSLQVRNGKNHLVVLPEEEELRGFLEIKTSNNSAVTDQLDVLNEQRRYEFTQLLNQLEDVAEDEEEEIIIKKPIVEVKESIPFNFTQKSIWNDDSIEEDEEEIWVMPKNSIPMKKDNIIERPFK